MSTVAVSATPLYQQGFGPGRLRTRFIHMAGAPRVPLYQGGRRLGRLGDDAAIIGTATSAAGKAIPTLFATTSWAGPVGVAVAAIGALIAGLMAKHELRVKQAQSENSSMNLGVQGWDSDIKQINQSYTSGQIDANGAIQAINVTMQNFWQLTTPHMQPGRNGCNSGSSCPDLGTMHNQNPCTGNIGAACCVGCFDLQWCISPELDGITAAIGGQSTNPAGKYVSRQPAVDGSKYGGQSRGAYTLDWTPPPPSALQSAASSLTSSFSGGGSSLLPILAIVAALAVFK